MTNSAQKKLQLEDAMDAHENRLIRYATRFLKDEGRARDVVQETFLKLWNVELSSIENHLIPWLFTVCRNLALDVLKKEKHMVSMNYNSSDADTGGTETQSALEAEQSVSLVLKLMNSLPVNQQEVIQLKFQNDLSYKEIADITGFSVSNVGFLIH
jgi:RNA polymerase sigma-70 factor (ECF subfamily)